MMLPKHIKLFITVPVDLEDEGYQIGAYIVELNRIYAPHGITIEITLLEEGNPNPDIKADDAINSDYFYVLFYRHSDLTAIDCFDRAIDHFRVNSHPKIYTYFREIPQGSSAEQGVLDFMQSLDEEMGHFYSLFSSVDSIKLDLILEIARDYHTTNSLDTHDGFLFADGEAVLDLDSLPPYAQNNRLRELREQRRELDTLIHAYEEQLDTVRCEADARKSFATLSMKRKTILDEIEQIEHDTLSVAIKLLSSSPGNTAMSKRILQARRLFQRGDIIGARTILEDEKIELEHERRRLTREALKVELENIKEEEQDFVEGRLILIDLIKAEGLSKTSDEKILAYYKQSFSSTLECELNPDFIPDYIRYLNDNRHFDIFNVVSKQAIEYTSSKFEKNPQEFAHAYIATTTHVGFGYIRMTFESSTGANTAEALYKDILPVAKQQAENANIPDAKRDYATLLGYYGIALIDQQNFTYAYKYLSESAAVGCEILKNDPSYKRYLAITYNSLALCFYRSNNIGKEAIEYVEESVKLRRELFEEDSNRNEIDYALGVYVKGALYRRFGDYETAETAFIDSIEMLERLSLALPDRAESLLASAEAGYSKLLIKSKRYDEALPLLEDAESIRSRWFMQYPDTYGRPLLYVLQKLHYVHSALGNETAAATVRTQIEALEPKTMAQEGLPDSD